MSSLLRFTRPETFRRFAPALLAQLLHRYPELLVARGIEIPQHPDADNMPYRQITELFLAIDETTERNAELYGAIHLVGCLSTASGRGAIFQVAEYSAVEFPPEVLSSNYDLALWTWLNHPAVLDAASYRVKMHSSRSFHYFRPVTDEITPLSYSEADVEEFRSALRAYYQAISKGSAAQVMAIEEEDELWLVVRHGGYIERRANIDDESSVCFRDEEYDIMIYNRTYGDLKIRNTDDSALEVLRSEFGRIFFGDMNGFAVRETFALNHFTIANGSFLSTTLVPGITSVLLKEVRYMLPGGYDRTVHEKSSNLLLGLRDRNSIVPPQALLVEYAHLAFRFEGSRQYRSVKLTAPNQSNYAREDDVRLVEQWLRCAGLMTSLLRESAVA
jgi:hypothetical protein